MNMDDAKTTKIMKGTTDMEDDTTCPRCNESRQLAKIKGCIKCLQCGFKFDCNGW
jgi:transcription elongation factor Elf1